MVKNRGIDVYIISQFDIQRLPEFPVTAQPGSEANNVVSCYVPIYPGSQIWFEYTIEPPHPPKAAYFFKLLINGRVITAWDCTEKYGYHGKMIYTLQKTEGYQEYPRESVQRTGFKFSSHDASETPESNTVDCIEIRVHRIEHRRRIRNYVPERDESLEEACGDRLQFINGGILEPGRPQRRYQYQLLDPQNEPFAIFRFLYRTYDYLQQNNIVPMPTSSLRSESTASTAWYEARSTAIDDTAADRQTSNVIGSKMVGADHGAVSTTEPCDQQISPLKQTQTLNTDTYLPLSDSDDSLSVVARDSIEDLPSAVSRAPDSPRSKRFSLRGSCYSAESPERHSLSPRQRLKKRLTLDLDRSRPSIEKQKRPLSPFTSGGLLRRMMSPEIPRTITPEAKPKIHRVPGLGEEESGLGLNRTGSKRNGGQAGTGTKTTQAVYDGKSWMGFFGRRVNHQDRGDAEKVGE